MTEMRKANRFDMQKPKSCHWNLRSFKAKFQHLMCIRVPGSQMQTSQVLLKGGHRQFSTTLIPMPDVAQTSSKYLQNYTTSNL